MADRRTLLDVDQAGTSPADETNGLVGLKVPVLICLLGSFRLLKGGKPVSVRDGSKTEILLSELALRLDRGLHRERVLCALWPERESSRATQSLNTLVCSLHRLLGDGMGGATPVLHRGGIYRLNAEAGIGVDLVQFDALVDEAERHVAAGNLRDSYEANSRAIRCYSGDLSVPRDTDALIERERLRARYLGSIARLADYDYSGGENTTCLEHALLLLANDPCREDAHRLVMRCNVRLGHRSQALRQYRLCEEILHREFDASPEPLTTALFDRVRLDPASI